MRKSDEAISEFVVRAQSADLDAFEELVREFELPVRAWAAAHCPPGIDPDEIAQCAFIVAYERLSQFEPGTNFSAWLFAIARYQLMNEMERIRRRADYRTRYSLECLDYLLEERAQSTGDAITEQLTHLSSCLDGLSERSRNLIAWRYDEGIPLEEMSNRTGRSLGAIKKQLWVLRQKLRKCIEARQAAEAGGA